MGVRTFLLERKIGREIRFVPDGFKYYPVPYIARVRTSIYNSRLSHRSFSTDGVYRRVQRGLTDLRIERQIIHPGCIVVTFVLRFIHVMASRKSALPLYPDGTALVISTDSIFVHEFRELPNGGGRRTWWNVVAD